MELELVNLHPKYACVALMDPPPTGYIHLAAVVAPPAGRTPFPRRTDEKTALLADLKSGAGQLESLDAVSKATVYRAIVTPPPFDYARDHASHPARYDVAVLIETASHDAVAEVQATEPYRLLAEALTAAAIDLHVMTARCVKRIADVDKTRPGLFLFNHFVAEDADVALRLWDYLAAWYVVETDLDNSTLLAPAGGDADYVFVNHARWDHSVPEFMVKQLAKRSFRSFVTANMRANRVGAMPILYRLA
jgi:hypothetical protein